MKDTARWRIRRRRNVAGEHNAITGRRRIGHRHRGQQRLRVRHQRLAIEIGGRCELDDLAEIHDRDTRRDVLDDGEIVRDEEIGEATIALEILQEIDHLRLNRNVECRYRLVTDDQLGLHRERPRDADALPLAARELVRVARRILGPEPDFVEELPNAFVRLGAGGELVDRQAFPDDRADRHPRIQAGERVLEDDLDPPAQAAAAPWLQRADVDAVELNLAGRRLDEAQDAAPERRLAAARLADDA